MLLLKCTDQLPLEVPSSTSCFQIFPKFTLSTNIPWKALLMSLTELSIKSLKDSNPNKTCTKLMKKEKLSLLKQKERREPKNLLKKKMNHNLNLNLSLKQNQKDKNQLKDKNLLKEPKEKSLLKELKDKNQLKDKEKNLLKKLLKNL